MKIWLRRALIAVAVLLVLVIAGVAVLLSTFDPNSYKGLAIDWMKAHHQRTLAIDGPIRLSVFPRLEVQVSAVSLSEAGRDQRFAAIEEAALAVQILPLWRRQLVVDRVQARGVSVVITRNAKGVRNIDDLLSAGTAPAAPAPGSSEPTAAAGQPLRFDVSRIEMTDVKATIHDEQVPLHGDIVLESLVTGRLADKVEAPVELKLRFALQEPVLKGTLSGSLKLTPDLATRSARLAGMQISYQGDAPGASDIAATLKGNLAYDGAKAAVQASDIDLAVGATVGAIKIASSSVKADTFEFDPARKALTLAKLQVRLAGALPGRAPGRSQAGPDPRGGSSDVPVGRGAVIPAKENFTLALDWPSLSVAGTALQGSALSGDVSLSGTHTLNGKFQSAAPSGSFDLVRVPGVVVALEGKSGPQAIDGKLSGDLLLRTAPAFVALEKLALQARIQTPGLQPLALDLGGTLSASAKEAQWQLSGKLNTNQFNTDGLARFAGKVPSVKVQARFDALDVNKVLGTPPQEVQAQASAPTAAAAADTPVNLQGLEGLQAQLALRAGSLVVRQYRVDNAQLEATLDAGVLKITKLQGQSWGGNIEASGFADARASKLGVQLAASGVNVNALLKDVAAKDLLEGTGRVTADLTSTGKTVGELRSRLAGQAAMQLRDGAIKGVNLAKSLRRAKATLGADQDAVEKAKQTEKTDFSELGASFQIANGIAKSTDLDAKSPFLRLGGAGSADIGHGRIDYTARATVTNTSKGQEGAELEALRGITVPVLLSGPFDAIDWKIQWSAIASDLVKARAGEKLRAQEDKLKDKLGAKLGIKPANPAASAASSPARSTKDAAKDKLKDKLKGLLK
jgi:AsmA protein